MSYRVLRCPRCETIQGRQRDNWVYGRKGPHKSHDCRICGFHLSLEEHLLFETDDQEEAMRKVGELKRAGRKEELSFRRAH